MSILLIGLQGNLYAAHGYYLYIPGIYQAGMFAYTVGLNQAALSGYTVLYIRVQRIQQYPKSRAFEKREESQCVITSAVLGV